MVRNKNFKCLPLRVTVFRDGEGGATFALNVSHFVSCLVEIERN